MNNMKKEFFFEVFSEEIPARMQKDAVYNSKESILKILKSHNVEHGEIITSCSPRRLYVCVKDVLSETMPITEEKRGPKIDANEKAIDGFINSNGILKNDLFEKNGYWFTKIENPGEKFIDKISQIFQDFVKIMPWPKSMHWYNDVTGQHSATWVRPVKSVVCLFGNQTINFNIDQFGISSSNKTKGNRFLSNKEIEVESFDDYLKKLKSEFVIPDFFERQETIVKLIEQKIIDKNILLKKDNKLLDEVTGLMEYPFVVIGDIENIYMELPDFVLATSMKVHQKYFSTQYKDGKVAPYFIAISNKDDKSNFIKAGFEKVLRARLNDAMFFFKEDLKQPLDSKYNKLYNVVFHEKLGSLGNKVDRLIMVAPQIKRAAAICKLDLLTNMVGEFDELQGIIGTYYAKKQGEKEEDYKAIEEHYRPTGQDDLLPITATGSLLAILDKLDSLIGFLGVGIKPTGSKDPFALRRSAIGIIRISIENKDIDLHYNARLIIDAYKSQGVLLQKDTFDNVVNFIHERLAVYLKDQLKIRYDVVNSIMSFYSTKSDNLNVYDIVNRAKSINDVILSEDNFMSLFTRINGIVSKSENISNSVDEKLFESEIEKVIFDSIRDISEKFQKEMSSTLYKNAMYLLSDIVVLFNKFFDEIQINVENTNLKNNRIALLTMYLNLYNSIADFSQIQTQ